MNFVINKNGKNYDIVVNEDLSATIDGKEAKFDPLYNAVVLNEGYVIEDQFIKGLRIDPKTVKRIIDLNKKFMKHYDKRFEEQRNYIPEIVRLNCGNFVYSNPFNPIVTTSEVIEKANLLIEGDQKLIKKISDTLMDDKGNIQTSDLLKLPEYKEYLKSLSKYDKIRKKYAEKEEKFNQLIKDKTSVALNECESCNNVFIIGSTDGKYLPKSVFFNAKDEFLDYEKDTNKYSEFCYGITDNFVYYMKGSSNSCQFCKI